jgi:hypothetical protein
VLTAVVERRVLTESVVLRGTVVSGRTVEVKPPETDADTRVITLGPGDQRRRVTVTTGATGDGFIAVESARLAKGDRVVIGK